MAYIRYGIISAMEGWPTMPAGQILLFVEGPRPAWNLWRPGAPDKKKHGRPARPAWRGTAGRRFTPYFIFYLLQISSQIFIFYLIDWLIGWLIFT